MDENEENDDGNLNGEGETAGEEKDEGGRLKDEGGETEEESDPEAKVGGVKFSKEQQATVNGLLAKEKHRRKEAEDKLAEADAERNDYKKRYGDADGETVMRAAQEAGVMPELLTAAEAEGVTKLENAKSNQKYLERMLRRSGDEFDVAGKKMTREEVEASADRWEGEAGRLESRFGSVKAKASETAREIWKLGVAAKKAGWDGKRAATGNKQPANGNRKPEPGDERRTPGPGDKPEARGRKPEGGKAVDWSLVNSGKMSLEQALAQQEMGKGKG